MRMSKKVVCGLLAMSLMSSMLCSCGKKKDAARTNIEDSLDEKIEISLTGAKGATDDWGDTDLIQYISKELNVTINCTPYLDDSFSNKLSLFIAEDSLPDIIVRPQLELEKANEYGSQGFFLPINEYLDYAPNLKKFLDEHEDFRKYMTAPDGNIYTLGSYDENYFNSISRTFINKKWLDKLNIDEPSTLDEFYDMLVAFRDMDPNGNGEKDEIPIMFANNYNRNALQVLLTAFGINEGSATDKICYLFGVESGKVILEDTTENYRDFLRFVHKLWEENLLYHESYSTEIARQRELTKKDRVGVFGDAAPYVATGGNITDAKNFLLAGGYTSKYNDKAKLIKSNSINPKPKILISANTKNPVRIMKILDLFFSDEWHYAGMEGFVSRETEKCSVDGFSDLQVYKEITDVPPEYDSAEVWRHKKKVINEAFNFVNLLSDSDDYIVTEGDQNKLDDIINAGIATYPALVQKRIAKTNASIEEEFPPLVFSAEVASERTDLQTDISGYLATATAAFIIGEKDIEKDWDSHIETLNSMGLDRLLKIQNDAYNSLKK